MRLSSEILPIVSVNTLSFIVLCVVRAPLRLEVKHKELLISGHFVDQGRFYVEIRVSKRAKLLVLALLKSLGTKFCFVLLDMVKSFHLVVGECTLLI